MQAATSPVSVEYLCVGVGISHFYSNIWFANVVKLFFRVEVVLLKHSAQRHDLHLNYYEVTDRVKVLTNVQILQVLEAQVKFGELFGDD